MNSKTALGITFFIFLVFSFVRCGVKGPPVPYVESVQAQSSPVPTQTVEPNAPTIVDPTPIPKAKPVPKSKGKKAK